MISKELRRNATCILILNLALGDLLISLVVNSFAVVGVMAGKAFFDRHMFMCEIVGALSYRYVFALFLFTFLSQTWTKYFVSYCV